MCRQLNIINQQKKLWSVPNWSVFLLLVMMVPLLFVPPPIFADEEVSPERATAEKFLKLLVEKRYESASEMFVYNQQRKFSPIALKRMLDARKIDGKSIENLSLDHVFQNTYIRSRNDVDMQRFTYSSFIWTVRIDVSEKSLELLDFSIEKTEISSASVQQ